MAGRIRDEDIQLVRERSPIQSVIGERVALRSAGGGALKGLCPFHEERTPSFNVRPETGYYHCFGCEEGGDVITFVQKVEGLTFVEAVEKLAARAGVTLQYEGGGAAPGRQSSLRQRLVEAHRAAADFYAQALERSAEAEPGRLFLAERGFTLADAAAFGVGFAPPGWDALARHLLGRFTVEELTTAGLVREGQRGPVDRFRGRLVWPIRELGGEVVGFGARRLLAEDTGPKYLNTPETPIFKKSALLYAADIARPHIRKAQRITIVEGYTDVMACHLAGEPTAVATCGTSFGDGHVAVVRRLLLDVDAYGVQIVFTFDGDEAGRKAALRAFEEDQRFVAQTYVAVEQHGLDPCELRMAHGDAGVLALVEAREPLVQFAIRSTLRRFDLEAVEGRVAALAETAPLVAKIKDPSLRPEYARRLAGWLGMDVEMVVARVTAAARSASRPAGRAPARSPRPDPPGSAGAAGDAVPSGAPDRPAPSPSARRATSGPGTPGDRAAQVERDVLRAAVQRPDLAGADFDTLDPAVFTVPDHIAVATTVAAAGGAGGAEPGERWVSRLREAAPEDRVRALVTTLAVEGMPVTDADDTVRRYVDQVLARLQVQAIDREIALLKGRLQRAGADDPQAEAGLFAELVATEQRRRRLLDRAAGE